MVLAVVACSSSYGSTEGPVTPPPADDGGVPPPDPCQERPFEEACLADALFVSGASGQDANDGTRSSPLKTIGTALKRVGAAKRRVYVCEGRYPEDVVLTNAQKGVLLSGGLDCAFVPNGSRPVVGASANPLRFVDTLGVTISDVAVDAANATDGSSIAAFAIRSQITLTRVRLSAGSGANGTTAATVPFTHVAAITLEGNDGNGGTGGMAKPNACPAGDSSTGGKGGNDEMGGDPGLPEHVANTGGTGSNCAVIGGAGLGRPGGRGPNGGAGASAGGHGGGAGGCGGAAGGEGTGGGASIALASLDATVRVTSSSFFTRDGGAGGPGAPGQIGGPGGVGGGGSGGCDGGHGGVGGTGGGGGGGAGGLSVAVLFKGLPPNVDAMTDGAITLGNAGQGGASGEAGSPGGIAGAKQPYLEIP
jgi:hypothetical protein